MMQREAELISALNALTNETKRIADALEKQNEFTRKLCILNSGADIDEALHAMRGTAERAQEVRDEDERLRSAAEDRQDNDT